MDNTMRTTADPKPRALAAESLIGLFSPPVPPVRVDPDLSLGDRHALWASDSLHRANNLAQLAMALARFGPQAVSHHAPDAIANSARLLAAAYADLADEAGPAMVPCACLLTRIVHGLVELFGTGPRPIGLRCSVMELRLSIMQRRALTLMASELVINALKYAFPHKGGTISVSLDVGEDSAELVVEDDGIGVATAAKPGNGSRILDELAVLLGAPVDRAQVEGGGLRVSIVVPLLPDGRGYACKGPPRAIDEM